MPISLSDTLNDPLGRWFVGSQSWDSTQKYNSEISHLTSATFQHVDLRTFHNTDVSRKRTLGEIDLLTMSTIEGPLATDPTDSIYDTMAELDALVQLPGENWTKTGNGFNALTVGPIAAKRNWRGLTTTTTGVAITTVLSSGIPVVNSVEKSAPINISAMTTLSTVFADQDVSFFDTTSYVQLTSNPTGVFGTAAYDSGQVTFASDIGATPNELRVTLTGFNTAAGASFSLGAVTGIRFSLAKAAAPAAGIAFSLLAIRALGSGWSYREIDFNTRLGSLNHPVTLTGAASTGLAGSRSIPLIRGSGAADDPRPADASLLAYFANGFALAGPPPTWTGTDVNKIDLYFREHKNAAANTGDWIRTQLRWTPTATFADIVHETFVGGTATSGAATTLTDTGKAWATNEWVGASISIVGGTGSGQTKTVASNTATTVTVSTTWATNPDATSVYQMTRQDGLVTQDLGLILSNRSSVDPDLGRYLFRASLVGTAMTIEVIKTTSTLAHIGSVYNQTFTNAAWAARGGRVGIHPDFAAYDTYLDQFSSASVGYATLRTKVYPSRKPVDGLRLEAAYSVDENLFSTISWVNNTERFVDTTKTVSGNGSYRTSGGVYTNEFLVEDWNNTYLDYYVWVPASVNATNQPTAYLVNSNTTIAVKVPRLQPSQWNHIRVELFPYNTYPTGRFYQLLIKPAVQDISLREYWVDAIKVGRRTVSWQARAKSSSTWREFFGMVNNSRAALHFPSGERGTQLQMQAVALSPDAWIASFRAQPRYAELGNFVFDAASEH